LDKVIDIRNLPRRAPTSFTIAVWLLLDRFSVGNAGMTVFYIIIGFIWISFIMQHTHSKSIDIFKNIPKE
jgi:hypothetical protein